MIKVREGDLIVQNDESLTTKMYLLQSALVEEVIVNLKLDRSEDINPERTLKETWQHIGGVKKVFQGRGTGRNPRRTCPIHCPRPVRERDRLRFLRGELATGAFRRDFQKESPGGTGLGRAIKELLGGTALGARLLKICTHPDPALAAAICNQLAQTLINHNTENKSEKFKGASIWLDRSTRELKARAERAEQALANYTRAHNNIAPQGKAR